MKPFLAMAYAALYGLFVRGMFGMFSGIMEVMGLTFLCLTPLIIGFLTIILWPKDQEISKGGAFGLPWLTSLAILIITILFSVEGIICWIMIFPFFGVAAGIGGLIGHRFRNKKTKKTHDPNILDDNDWNNPSSLQISLLVLVPFFLGALEGDRISSYQYTTIEKTTTIEASPEEVWQAITTLKVVNHADKETYFTNTLGFPKHLHTTLDTCAVGGKRIAHYEKGLYFEETITEMIPNEKLVLAIHVDPEKIPATVLDEHIVIGGKHVDVLEDIYTLQENPDGTTRLSLSSKYVINTPFNWYAGVWAEYLMSDLLKGELRLMKQRAEDKMK